MADLKISQLTGATTPLAGTEVLPIVQSSSTKKVTVANLTAGRAVTALSLATDAAAANVTISGIDITSGGSSADVGLSIKPKGAGGVSIYNSADADARILMSGNTTGGDPYFRMYDRAGALNLEFQADTGVASRSFAFYGNIGVGSAGYGVNFTANTPAAGMTSQLLNWYEEGAWTPTDASGAALTFTSAAGSYTRVGRLVNWQAVIAYPSTANASDSLIGGLPFTVAGGSASQGRAGAFVSLTDVATLVHIMQVDSSTTLRPYKAGFVRATNADLSSSNIYIGGFFVV